MTLYERFEEKYMPEPMSGCWLWTAFCNPAGYGMIKGNGKKSPVYLAHRFSYEHHVGPIAGDLCVLHKCDTPACVNPDHLFLGTRQDNNADMLKKGRRATFEGLKNGRTKLKEADVLKIRRLLPTMEREDIAKMFNVHKSRIYKIQAGTSWGHI